jgi:hypothetical protein
MDSAEKKLIIRKLEQSKEGLPTVLTQIQIALLDDLEEVLTKG